MLRSKKAHQKQVLPQHTEDLQQMMMESSSSTTTSSPLDLEFFESDLSDKQVTLLPDGTVCYPARYAASKAQGIYCVALIVTSPVVVAMLHIGSGAVKVCGIVLSSLSFAVLLLWHAQRYRRYAQEVRAGCHMQGVFLFAATRDVVLRFHRALADVEESCAKDTVLNVDVRTRCCRDCLVVDSVSLGPGGAPPRVVVPASWLVDDPHLIANSIREHLELGAASFGVGLPMRSLSNDRNLLSGTRNRLDSDPFGYEGSYRGPLYVPVNDDPHL